MPEQDLPLGEARGLGGLWGSPERALRARSRRVGRLGWPTVHCCRCGAQEGCPSKERGLGGQGAKMPL